MLFSTDQRRKTLVWKNKGSSGGKHCISRWYQRQGRSTKFHAMFNSNKTPYLSKLENSNVMMWQISIEKDKDSFYVTPYRLSQIIKEYKKYDDMYSGRGPSRS